MNQEKIHVQIHIQEEEYLNITKLENDKRIFLFIQTFKGLYRVT